jgi:hypothetical protein
MGEAKRRRSAAEASRLDQLQRQSEETLTDICRDGQNVFALWIIRCSEMPSLVADAMNGDALAAQQLQTVLQFVANVERSRPPAGCLTCGHRLASKDEVAVITAFLAYREDPMKNAIVSGMCRDCAMLGDVRGMGNGCIWKGLQSYQPSPFAADECSRFCLR